VRHGKINKTETELAAGCSKNMFTKRNLNYQYSSVYFYTPVSQKKINC